ncbi:MAG TPA: Holliday junction resolvase RuvX [bacterium]|mgnify:CR=1 FL=1|nr:MAG: putative Holliday junction resolvase [bacterium ADurb.Bin236]HPI76334.1 Holliday junction resolvase RuvX [bacterium]HPN95875.1 Holliday junction resolvase RuvX [bacterium]
MGIDYGGARLGIAVSDDSGVIAFPFSVVPTRGDVRKALGDIIRGKNVDRVVVGYPLDREGNPGPAAARVEAFAERLRRWFGLDVVLWDERYTTAQASAAVRKSGSPEQKGQNDMAAAAILLQSWLDADSRP